MWRLFEAKKKLFIYMVYFDIFRAKAIKYAENYKIEVIGWWKDIFNENGNKKNI